MKQLFLFVCALSFFEAISQQPDFVVYGVNGKVTITRPGAPPVAVLQKQPVFKNDVFVLEKSSRVMLSDKDGNKIELRSEGRFPVDELMNKENKRATSGSTSNYLRLLYHELFDPEHDFEKFKKRNIGNVSGGVTRSEDCRNRISPADGIKTSFRTIVFRWRNTSPTKKYVLSIFDGDKELLALEVSDTLKSIDLKEVTKSIPGEYYWNVASKDGTCEADVPSPFDLITAIEEAKLVADVKMNAAESTLEKQLQKIDELDRMGLVYAAADAYASLVKANSNDKALLKSYILYLLENGLDEEAAGMWQN